MSPTRTKDPVAYREQRQARRRSGALQTLATVPAEIDLEVPPPVTEVVRRYKGVAPKLPAEAFELARQVYYLQHGSMAECARAIIAAGLGDSSDETVVRERLQTWWNRERWPKRPIGQTIALRDAAADGGLYRGRLCKGLATGSGPAPKGTPCGQTALEDSDFCSRHDPRPEYKEMRERTGRRLAAARAVEFVPIEPFREWLKELRDRLVAEEKSAGRLLHHNSEGWHLVAEVLDLHVSQLGRWAQGGKKRGEPIIKVKAGAVVKYAGKVGVSFEEIYGFEAPRVGKALDCPGCGGRKNQQSRLCRKCWEGETYGVRCSYVNGKGERCPVSTRHPSGQCGKCRRITERVPRPRLGRKTSLTSEMLLFALDEYRSFPSLEWVSSHLWATDAGGVRSAYKTRKSLTGTLAKQFRKRGLVDAAAIEVAHAELVAELGPVEWPPALEEAGDTAIVPFAPFLGWIEARLDELGRRRGCYTLLGERTGIFKDTLSQWVRGVGRGEGKATVRRDVVEAALEGWGDGTTFEDLYGGDA